MPYIESALLPQQLHLKRSNPVSKIRVLHVLYVLNQAGGVETWLTNILRYIDHDRFQLDFLVHIHSPDAPVEHLQSLGGRVFQCPHPRQFGWRFWEYGQAFKQLLNAQEPYDIIHTHTAHFSGYLLMLAQQVRIPVRITHSHDDASQLEMQSGLRRQLYLKLTKFLVGRYSTSGLATSQKAAAYLFGPRWQTDPRWQVLHCGIDCAQFYDNVEAQCIRSEFGISEQAFVIGYLGRLAHQKNPLFFLDVVAAVAPKIPNLRVLMIGDGALRSAVERKIMELGLQHIVILAGMRSDVAQLLKGAIDVLLVPSHHEGLGLVAVEAQAAGVRCLVSDVVPEEADLVPSLVRRLSLSESVSGWASEVLDLYQTPSIVTPENALTLVQHSTFSITRSIQALSQLYQQSYSKSKPFAP
jgi:glycosyltransferase involved in cell wall biosynthesis